MYKKVVLGVALVSAMAVSLPHKIWQAKPVDPQIAGISTVGAGGEDKQFAAPEFLSNIQPPQVSAKAALAIDLNTGTNLYSWNFDEKLPIASLTKLMTAMVVLDKVNKDSVVTVEKSDLNTECVCMGLVTGEQITVENLLKGMLIPSSNDAAQVLARFVAGDNGKFEDLMNQKAERMNLTSTHFSTPVGLDSSDNYSTTLDLSKIVQEFLKYDLLSKIVDTKSADVTSTDGKIVHHLHTTNKLLLENPEVVGVKTGFTSQAQGNLIIKIKHGPAEVLTVVLNTPNREEDTQKLIDWVFKAYRW